MRPVIASRGHSTNLRLVIVRSEKSRLDLQGCNSSDSFPIPRAIQSLVRPRMHMHANCSGDTPAQQSEVTYCWQIVGATDRVRRHGGVLEGLRHSSHSKLLILLEVYTFTGVF